VALSISPPHGALAASCYTDANCPQGVPIPGFGGDCCGATCCNSQGGETCTTLDLRCCATRLACGGRCCDFGKVCQSGACITPAHPFFYVDHVGLDERHYLLAISGDPEIEVEDGEHIQLIGFGLDPNGGPWSVTLVKQGAPPGGTQYLLGNWVPIVPIIDWIVDQPRGYYVIQAWRQNDPTRQVMASQAVYIFNLRDV